MRKALWIILVLLIAAYFAASIFIDGPTAINVAALFFAGMTLERRIRE